MRCPALYSLYNGSKLTKCSKGNFCAYVLAIILPPLPVFMKRGCGADALINVGLCCLAWLPGVIRKQLFRLTSNISTANAKLRFMLHHFTHAQARRRCVTRIDEFLHLAIRSCPVARPCQYQTSLDTNIRRSLRTSIIAYSILMTAASRPILHH